MSQGNHTYDASQIKVLEGLDAVRGRPGMYIGSTGERGLHGLVLTAIDRTVNEVLAGRARSVEVTLLADGAVRVAHDGDSWTDPEDAELAVQLERLPGRWWPYDRRCVVSWFDLGLAVVNALSDRLTVQDRKDGELRSLAYEFGRSVPAPPVAPATGAVLTFRPDPGIFPGAVLSFDTLAERLRELAFLNRELDLTLTGGGHSERFRSPGGLRDYLVHLYGEDQNIHAFEQDVPAMGGTLEVAFVRTHGPDRRIRSFVNSFPTRHGTHVEGLLDGACTPHEGLTAIVSVKLDRAEFDGCRQDFLANEPVRSAVAEAVRRHLEEAGR
ncbi:DNA gyrase subunit B [Kitasatospora sp. NPDC088134]|uniref:DNA gyrase subunit B n=1 Tax=Kitasatospora sp. NPDC088134 TaxID=3364071 RepID=UPI003820D77C